jgi:hypothetical protein
MPDFKRVIGWISELLLTKDPIPARIINAPRAMPAFAVFAAPGPGQVITESD